MASSRKNLIVQASPGGPTTGIASQNVNEERIAWSAEHESKRDMEPRAVRESYPPPSSPIIVRQRIEEDSPIYESPNRRPQRTDSALIYSYENDFKRAEETPSGALRSTPQGPDDRSKDLWTEITKDLVTKEAIEAAGYDYQETESFYYVLQYLSYDEVSKLIEMSRRTGRRAKERITDIEVDGLRIEIEDLRRDKNAENTPLRARVVERFSGVEKPRINSRQISSPRPTRAPNVAGRRSHVRWDSDRDRLHGKELDRHILEADSYMHSSMPPPAPLEAGGTRRKDFAETRTADSPMGGKRPSFLEDDYAENERKALARREARREERTRRQPPSPSDSQRGTVWTVESERDIDRPRPSRRRSSPHIEPVRAKSILRERVQSPARESLLEDADVIWNPSSSRDTTVHLEVDIEDDIEGYLEEFSRLSRLGHFKEAEQRFEQNLIDNIRSEPVLLEYMDMLSNRGDYIMKEFLRGSLPRDPPPSHEAPEPAEYYGANADDYGDSGSSSRGFTLEFAPDPHLADDEDAAHILQLEQRITRARIGMKFRFVYQGYYNAGLLKAALDFATSDDVLEYTSIRRSDSNIESNTLLCSSSDLQIIQYYLKIMSCVRDQSSFLSRDVCHNIWSDWKGLYKSLLSEGRIWDVCDIITASVSALGEKKTWRNFFDADIYSAGFLVSFLHDWDLDEYDDSSYLATLELLSSLAQALVSKLRLGYSLHAITAAKRVCEYARRFSKCIKENNPEYIKSRPYLRWILVEEELARHLPGFESGVASLGKHLNNFPGITIWSSSLPIYVPVKYENPGWYAYASPAKSDDLLQAGLRAARDLGDYHLEANFLRELSCRCKDPIVLLNQLADLQKDTQGDMIGYLQTCLTKYLLVHDETSRQALKDELADYSNQLSLVSDSGSKLEDPLTCWCTLMIQSSLFRSKEQSNGEMREVYNAALAVAPDLPRDIKSDLSRSNLHQDMMRDRQVSSDSRDYSANHELERSKRELEAQRLEVERETREQVKKEAFLEKLKEARNNMAASVAVEEYRREQEMRKREAEQKEKEYRARLVADVSESGIDTKEAGALIKWVSDPSSHKSTSTRMSRKDVSLEALKRYKIDYELDNSTPDIIVIKRAVPSWEQDFLRARTKEIRSQRSVRDVDGQDTRYGKSRESIGNGPDLSKRKSRWHSDQSISGRSINDNNESDGSISTRTRRPRSRSSERYTSDPLVVSISPISQYPNELEVVELESEKPMTHATERNAGPSTDTGGPQIEEEEGGKSASIETAHGPMSNTKHTASASEENAKSSNDNGKAFELKIPPGIEVPRRRSTFAHVESESGDEANKN